MNVGLIIKEKITKKDSNQSKVAKVLGKTSQTLNQQLSKNHTDTDLIVNISKTIKHNIFYDLALELEKEDGLKIPRIVIENDSEINKAIIELIKKEFPNIFK